MWKIRSNPLLIGKIYQQANVDIQKVINSCGIVHVLSTRYSCVFNTHDVENLNFNKVKSKYVNKILKMLWISC